MESETSDTQSTDDVYRSLSINLVTIRVFAQHILQTQCVSGTEYGLWGQCLSGVLSLGTYL